MSLTQPWCDKSHKGTSFLPFVFSIEEPVKEIWVCGCKLTSNPPFCDKKTCKNASNKI